MRKPHTATPANDVICVLAQAYRVRHTAHTRRNPKSQALVLVSRCTVSSIEHDSMETVTTAAHPTDH